VNTASHSAWSRQVMQHRGGEEDVELFLAEVKPADVADQRRDRHVRRGGGDAGGRAVDHRAAQVDQGRAADRGELFEQLERVVPCAAADVEHVAGRRIRRGGGGGDQLEHERRVDRRDWPVSRFENRSTSLSNRARISSTLDLRSGFAHGAATPPPACASAASRWGAS
jgi:hypothetical protein